jgi:hypothetical protein
VLKMGMIDPGNHPVLCWFSCLVVSYWLLVVGYWLLVITSFANN